ncbi:MAG: hypothetical protein AAF442_06015 [Pseudomonadota bacterium]
MVVHPQTKATNLSFIGNQAQEQTAERNKQAYHQYADTRLQAKQEALRKVAEGPVFFGGKGPLMPDPPRNYQEWMDAPP